MAKEAGAAGHGRRCRPCGPIRLSDLLAWALVRSEAQSSPPEHGLGVIRLLSGGGRRRVPLARLPEERATPLAGLPRLLRRHLMATTRLRVPPARGLRSAGLLGRQFTAADGVGDRRDRWGDADPSARGALDLELGGLDLRRTHPDRLLAHLPPP